MYDRVVPDLSTISINKDSQEAIKNTKLDKANPLAVVTAWKSFNIESELNEQVTVADKVKAIKADTSTELTPAIPNNTILDIKEMIKDSFTPAKKIRPIESEKQIAVAWDDIDSWTECPTKVKYVKNSNAPIDCKANSFRINCRDYSHPRLNHWVDTKYATLVKDGITYNYPIFCNNWIPKGKLWLVGCKSTEKKWMYGCYTPADCPAWTITYKWKDFNYDGIANGNTGTAFYSGTHGVFDTVGITNTVKCEKGTIKVVRDSCKEWFKEFDFGCAIEKLTIKNNWKTLFHRFINNSDSVEYETGCMIWSLEGSLEWTVDDGQCTKLLTSFPLNNSGKWQETFKIWNSDYVVKVNWEDIVLNDGEVYWDEIKIKWKDNYKTLTFFDWNDTTIYFNDELPSLTSIKIIWVESTTSKNDD